MSRLRFILPLLFLTAFAFGQTMSDDVSTISDGESGASVRTSLNEDITSGNVQTDTIRDNVIRLSAVDDSIAAHRIVIDNHTDSITALRAAITLNDAEIADLNDSITVHRTDINNNIDSLAIHLDSIQALRVNVNNNTDSLAVHLDTLQAVRVDVNSNIDSLGVHLDTLQAHRVDINKNIDSLAVHLDSLQAIRTDVNTNSDSITEHRTDINNNIDSLAVHLDTLQAVRVDVNKNSDSITIHRDDLGDLLSAFNIAVDRILKLEDSVYTDPAPTNFILNYAFNFNVNDTSLNNNHGTASPSIYYVSTDQGFPGTLISLYKPGQRVTTPIIDLGNVFSIGLDVIIRERDTSGRVMYYMNEAFKFVLNPPDSSASFITFSSPTDSSVYATPSGSYAIDTVGTIRPHRFLVSGNKTTNEFNIDIDGREIVCTGSVKASFNTSDSIVLGEDWNSQNPADVSVDNFMIYNTQLSTSERQSDYTNNEYYSYPLDATAPLLLYGSVGDLRNDMITLVFNEALGAMDEDSLAIAFTAEKNFNDASISIDSAEYDGSRVYLFTATILSTDTVRVNYTQTVSGGVIDLAGNQLATLTDSSVANDLCTSVELAEWGFNNDATDELGIYDGSDTGPGNVPYNNTDPIEGTHAGYFNLGADYFIDLPTLPLGDAFTITGWYRKDGGTQRRPLITNLASTGNDGFAIEYNGATDILSFRAVNSSSAVDSAYGAANMNDNSWHHWAVTVDKNIGRVLTYFDGALSCSDSTISAAVTADYTTNSTFRVSQYTNGLLGCACRIDDPHMYSGVLTEEAITFIKENPGERWTGCGSGGDPPVPDPSDFSEYYQDSVFAITFEDRPTVDPYTEAEMNSDFDTDALTPINYTVGLGENPTGTYNADIVNIPTLDGGTGDETRCLRIRHRAGFYGLTGAIPEGSGASFEMIIPAGYQELYLTWNVMRNEGAEGTKESKNPCLMGDFTWNNNIGFRAMSIMNRTTEYAHQWLLYLQEVETASDRWLDPDGGNWSYDWSDSVWYNITYRVCVNTQGNANGLVEAFINGRMVSQKLNVRLSTASSPDIDRMVVVYFIGGNQPNFAPSTDQFYHIDDIYLFNYKSEFAPAIRVASQPGRTLPNHPGWDFTTGKKK